MHASDYISISDVSRTWGGGTGYLFHGGITTYYSPTSDQAKGSTAGRPHTVHPPNNNYLQNTFKTLRINCFPDDASILQDLDYRKLSRWSEIWLIIAVTAPYLQRIKGSKFSFPYRLIHSQPLDL